MQVSSTPSEPALRLVQPTQAVQSQPPVSPSTRPLSVQRSNEDTYSFEAAYRSQLPRVRLTEAFYRLQRIREQLVGAQVNQPMRFEDTAPAAPAANPYASTYGTLQPTAAQANEAATLRRVDESA